MDIIITRGTLVKGKRASVGDRLNVEPSVAQFLIAIKKAEIAPPEKPKPKRKPKAKTDVSKRFL